MHAPHDRISNARSEVDAVKKLTASTRFHCHNWRLLAILVDEAFDTKNQIGHEDDNERGIENVPNLPGSKGIQ